MTPAHHLYAVVWGSKPYRDHVLLRDYLRSHPQEAHRYAAMKKAATARYPHDRDTYQAAKTDIIEEMLRRASHQDTPSQ